MQKFVAIFLAVALLSVSSVPMVAEAASCAPADHILMQQDIELSGHEHGHDMHMMDAEVHHDHAMSMSENWQKDRIECGCGCHRNVDALPHLLAPHAVTATQFETELFSVPSSEQIKLQLFIAETSVPIPPPQYI